MNSFTRIIAAATFVAGTLSAHAGTITFGSYVGTTPAGYTNAAVTSSAGTTVASTTPYNNAIGSSEYVTFANGNQPATTTKYFTTLGGGNLLGYGGSLSIYADDTVTIFLNGQQLAGTPTTGPYNLLYTVGLPTADFIASNNVLEFDVNNNNGGPTAFDFQGTAATPEPSSLILLGSGLVSAAGMIIRKRRVQA